jgi:hypothetical protein
MYGSFLDFSSVTLPGVGGGINASNSISMDQLQALNKAGKKWAPDKDGGMSYHNEAALKRNETIRARQNGLINREYNENADGDTAMKEIMARRKNRMESFKELKKKEYNFADDSELLSQPLAFKQKKCDCGVCNFCRENRQKDAQFREWDTAKRKQLKEGKFKGEFAGPNMSFPISSPEDVAAAWSSVGRGANPRKIMAAIIRIAKKHGWMSGLPESVKQRLDEGKSGLPE